MTTRTLKNNARFLASTILSRRPATFEGENAFTYPDTVDDINAVPERARGLYMEKDGKFVYTDVGNLRNSLTNARSERDAAKRDAAQAAEWKKLGKSPEEIQQLLDAQAESDRKKLEDKGQWEALKEQMTTNHNNALAEKDKVVGKYKSALEKALIDDGLRAALGEEEVGGNPLFLLPAMRGRVQLEETDDGFRHVVKREDGTPMLNAKSEPASLKDLALEFKSQDAWSGAFKGLNQSGGGAQGQGGGQGGGGGGATKKRSEMTVVEKVAYIKAHGQAEYEKLPQ